ncbi:MFS transporter [Rugamonas sp. FT82W]|uniref:MFS transporter n=2 Tax=Duganella vulcania TaxID=2692166 RepID=A0A845FTW6_9BURK|nr:MFS transporter [Duganella vulcania]
MRTSIFKSRPLLWVPTGYFTMALTSMTLTSSTAIMFKNFGLNNAKSAEYASLLLLIYTIKPLFAPMVEIYRTKKFFVLTAQVAIGLGFIATASVMALPNFMVLMMVLLLIISFFGATQDIASDGVYVTSLNTKEQSLYCGVQSLSWSLGPMVASGGLVYLSGWLHSNYYHHSSQVSGPEWAASWRIVFLIVGGLALMMAAWHAAVMPDGDRSTNHRISMGSASTVLRDAIATFFQKPGIWAMIAFAFCFRSSIGLLEKIGPFFLVDPIAKGGLGLSNELLGVIYGTYGLGAFLLGSLLGGAFVTRRGLHRPLLLLLACAVNLPGVTFLFMSMYQPGSLWIVTVGVVIEKFFFGFGSVGYMIYLMQQLAPGKYPTTHYAFGTALLALCMMVTGMISGHLQQMVGYVSYFAIVMVAIIPSFLVTWFAPFPHKADIVHDKPKWDSEKELAA